MFGGHLNGLQAPGAYPVIAAIGTPEHGSWTVPGRSLTRDDFASAAREGGFQGQIHVGEDLLVLRLPRYQRLTADILKKTII